MHDWEWNGVLVALDFTPQLVCDICEIHHPASWHCRMSCGCSLFVCNAYLIMTCQVFHENDLACPLCDAAAAWVVRGRPI